MQMPSNRRAQIDSRQELAVDSTDRLFIERERNRYASRGLALVVLLNGIGALVVLALLAQNLATNNVKAFGDAMMVFSGGALLGLTSALIAYVNRTIRLEWPEFTPWRRPLRWLAAAAAILAAACFLVGMNIVRIAIEDDAISTTRPKTILPQPPPEQPTEPQTTKPPTEPQPVEPRATEPPAPQEPQPPQEQPIEPQPEQEPNKPQTTEPPTTEPLPLEPQQTKPQQLRETKGVNEARMRLTAHITTVRHVL